MNIYGEKTYLRAIELSDAELLLKIINDPETDNLLGGGSWPVSEKEQLTWIEKQTGRKDVFRAIITTREGDMPVGTIILTDISYKDGTAQLHIKLSPNGVRRKGYGSDAIRTLVKYAFKELRLHCIYATILTYNTDSIKTFEKCGFSKEGILRARSYKNGEYVDSFSYSIVAEDL